MVEYINRLTMLRAATNCREAQNGMADVADLQCLINCQPAEDVVPVIHAQWMDRGAKTWCSHCNKSNKQYKPPFCPHCGARMDLQNTEHKTTETPVWVREVIDEQMD